MDADLNALAVGIIRLITYAGYVLVAGTFTFWALVWPTGHRSRRLMVLAAVGIALSAAAVVAEPLARLSLGQPVAASVTGWTGAVLAVRLAALAAAGFFLPDIIRAHAVGWRRLTPLLIVVALAATLVARSDAVDGSWRVLSTLAATGHVLATAAWLGGLVALVTVLVGRRRLLELDQLVPRLAAVSTASVLTLVLTGAVQALVEAGGLHALAASTYGLVLLIKAALFGVVLVVGQRGRAHAARVAFRASYATHEAELVNNPRVHALVVVVATELAIAAAILVSTAVLVAYAPS